MEALARCPLDHITWGVLTLPRKAREELSLTEQYRSLVDRWGMLAKYIRRTWGDFDYAMVVEQHGNGVPHCNIIIVSKVIAEQLRVCPHTPYDRKENVAPHWWRDLTAHCGFGWRVTLEHVAGRHEVASYCTKMEKGAVSVPHALGAEVVKTSQLPVAAPKRFRRFRTSKGFLPPIRKDPEISGKLVRTPLPQEMREDHGNGTVRLMEALGLGEALGRFAPAEQGEWGTREDVEKDAGDWTRWWRFLTPPVPQATVHREAESTSAPAETRRGPSELEVFRRAARGETDTWVRAPEELRQAVRLTGQPGEDGEERPYVPGELAPQEEERRRGREAHVLRKSFNLRQELFEAAQAMLRDTGEEQAAVAVGDEGRLVISTLLSPEAHCAGAGTSRNPARCEGGEPHE